MEVEAAADYYIKLEAMRREAVQRADKRFVHFLKSKGVFTEWQHVMKDKAEEVANAIGDKLGIPKPADFKDEAATEAEPAAAEPPQEAEASESEGEANVEQQ